MSRIRTVKPELFRHEQLFEAEKKYRLPLRLAFIGLFTCCDRDGRFRWKPRQLKLDVLPYDDLNMDDVLNALVESGFIVRYEVVKEYYGYIPSWKKHQHINIREPVSTLPSIEQGSEALKPNNQAAFSYTCMHVQTHTQPVSAYESSDEARYSPYKPDISPSSPDVHQNKIILEVKSIIELDSPSNTAESENLQSDDKPLETQTELNNFSSDETSHFDECPLLLPDEAGACTCMHVGKRKGTGRGIGRGKGSGSGKGKEITGELGANRNIVAQARRQPVISADILSIFDFWKITFQHPQAVLDPKRQRLIRQALQSGYSVAQLCDAISGCSKTSHNMGDNDRGQCYDGLHIILRDSDQIERFIRNQHNPPRPPNPADKLLQANVDAATNWLNKRNPTGAKL